MDTPQVSLILINTQLPHDFKWQVMACHLGLYKEVEVKHTNGVRPTFLELQLVGC